MRIHLKAQTIANGMTSQQDAVAHDVLFSGDFLDETDYLTLKYREILFAVIFAPFVYPVITLPVESNTENEHTKL